MGSLSLFAVQMLVCYRFNNPEQADYETQQSFYSEAETPGKSTAWPRSLDPFYIVTYH